MNAGEIAFPNLGIYLHNVPKSFSVFGFTIAFYGLIIGIGVMAGLLAVTRIAKKTGQNPDDYWDLAIWGILFGVVGARLYYVVFSWDDYKDNLLNIFKLRSGGLAIYGGVIAAYITLYVWCRTKKKSMALVGDTAMPGLILGQAIGRWGNFMNREAHGAVTDCFFKMGLVEANGQTVYYHPTFLYESVWNLVGFIGLHVYSKRRKFDGEVFLLYMGWYGLGRAWIEGLRTDSLYLFSTGIRVSQLLAVIFFVVSAAAIVWVRLKRKPTPEGLYVNRKRAAEAAEHAGQQPEEPEDSGNL